jgi:hypothetical protein
VLRKKEQRLHPHLFHSAHAQAFYFQVKFASIKHRSCSFAKDVEFIQFVIVIIVKVGLLKTSKYTAINTQFMKKREPIETQPELAQSQQAAETLRNPKENKKK